MTTLVGVLKSRSFRPAWLLAELDVPFEHVPAAPRSDEVLRHNPSGKIPVLVEDGVAITDSTAILTYLADRHGRLTAPAGTLDRARQDAMTQRLLDEVDACLWTAARHSFVLPEDRRVPAVKDSLKWEFTRSIRGISEVLANRPFLMGDSLSVPDIIAVHCGGWAQTAGFPLEDKLFLDYLDRLRDRPAFRKTVALMAA